MKSPLATTLCCLLGILAAGVPLVFFSTARLGQPGSSPFASATEQGSDEQQQEVPVLIRYTDNPVKISISRMGRELCVINAPSPSGQWQGKLLLPRVAPGSVLELEIEALWPDPLIANQAITVELAPDALPAARDTAWADTGVGELHTLFIFRW